VADLHSDGIKAKRFSRWADEVQRRPRLIGQIAQQRANMEQDWCGAGRIRRWALCLKAAICVSIGSVRGGYPDYAVLVLDVCAWSFHTCEWGYSGTEYDWMQLSVSSGLVRRWHVHEFQNGT
jgi:hypothetical protein